MRSSLRISRILLSACALASTPLLWQPQAQPITHPGRATPWHDLHGGSRVRLVAGASGAGYVAGVELALAAGWKTYWRMPGDAGVPPVFDWSGSSNVATIEVLFPAPIRLIEPAAQTVGYKGSAMFPVKISPKDASKPIDLKLALELGICREICVPATASLELAIPPGAGGRAPPALLAALDRVPRPQTARRKSDPELLRVDLERGDVGERLTVQARFAPASRGRDVFIEAPDGIFVPLPKRSVDLPDGSTRFEVDLSRGDIARELKGKTLTLTLVSDAGASEASWTIH
jgi:DsbC/DsbD-like thiol-disulfide interchange protein